MYKILRIHVCSSKANSSFDFRFVKATIAMAELNRCYGARIELDFKVFQQMCQLLDLANIYATQASLAIIIII